MLISSIVKISFPMYILPSLPFRRRLSTEYGLSDSSSNSSTEAYLPGHASILCCSRCLAHLCSSSQIISKGFTGRYGKAYLVAPPPPSLPSSVSPSPCDKGGPFTALGQGPELPNTRLHKVQPRLLVTGPHVVCDISCNCGNTLGWKYISAEEEAQKYKVGKIILETKRIIKLDWWESDIEQQNQGMKTFDARSGQRLPKTSTRRRRQRRQSSTTSSSTDTCTDDDDSDEDKEELIDECPIEFDSQDEYECEDLFLGVWNEALAKKRRRENVWRKAC